MGELINKIISFFESEKVSISRKITIPVLIGLTFFLFDNILGTSYYWMNTMKVDYIAKIEDAKLKCALDSNVLLHLDNKLNEAVNRKNIFQQFASLFENTGIEYSKQENNVDVNNNILSAIEGWFPTLERNQMWQTITSSLLWLILFGLLLLFSIFVPFIVEKDKIATSIGVILGLGFLAFLIWVTQWLFGLIPVILNRAYINYGIQLVLNLIPITLLTIGSIKEAKKKRVK